MFLLLFFNGSHLFLDLYQREMEKCNTTEILRLELANNKKHV